MSYLWVNLLALKKQIKRAKVDTGITNMLTGLWANNITINHL